MKNRIGIVNSGYNLSDSIFYNPLFQYPTAIPNYLQLLWFPVDLTLYHTMYVLPLWLNWLIFLNYLALLIYFYVKDKRYFWSLCFIFMAIAPSISPIKVSWLVAERYMFLGSLGYCSFLALLIVDHEKKLKLVAPTLIISILIYYTVRTYTRNIDWQTNHNLWVNTCQVSPNSHNAWNNIGDDYDKIKDYDNAIKGFTQSVLVKPNYADAYHNQANIFYKIGRLDLASLTYEKGLSYNPYLYQSYMSLVQIDLTENNIDSLTNHLNKMQQIKPNDPQVIYISAAAYAKVGKIEEAKKLADVLYKQFPNIKEVKDLYDSLNTEHKN
jgi:tetratricopeptide (TPR) repeat protein